MQFACTRPETALVRQDKTQDQMLAPEERQLWDETRDWCRLVWDTWNARPEQGGRLSLADVCLRLDLQFPERWPLMRVSGKQGGSLLNDRVTRYWWDKKLGMAAGHPNWDNGVALIRRWSRGAREKTPEHAAFLQQVMQLFLHTTHPKLLKCYRKVKRLWALEGMEELAPSYSTVQNYEAAVNPRVKVRYRDGGKVYSNTIRGWVSRQCNRRPGEAFVCDHRTMDFWCRIPHPDNSAEDIAVRPYITIIEDVASGVIVKALIYADQYPNHERILECVQEALRAAGNVTPLVWITDRGKDFLKIGFATPVTLRTAAGDLVHDGDQLYRHAIIQKMHTEHDLARGYNGKQKTAERRFADVAGDFDKTQPGYCGNSPATRPDFGETWQGDVRRLPTLQQVIEQFNDWVANEYNCRLDEHGRPRIEIWNERPQDRLALSDRELFFAMLLPQAVCPVVGRTPYGTGGVSHKGWTYSHIELREFWGRPVMIKTYWGMPQITEDKHQHPAGLFVFQPDGRFICAVAADRTAAMFADTPEKKQMLATLSHIINAAAATEAAEFETLTGRKQITSPDHVLRALPGHSVAPICGTALPGTPGGRRRVKAATQSAGKLVEPAPLPTVTDPVLLAQAGKAVFGDTTPETEPGMAPAAETAAPAEQTPAVAPTQAGTGAAAVTPLDVLAHLQL